MGEARREPGADRIGDDSDYRDRWRGALCGESGGMASRQNDVDLVAHELLSQLGEIAAGLVCEAIFDRNVSALDIAVLMKTLPKTVAGHAVGRKDKEPEYRHRLLLRARTA